MSISKSRIKNNIDKDRVKGAIKNRIRNYLKPKVKTAIALRLDKEVADLSSDDYSNELDDAVRGNTDLINVIVDEIIKEMKTAVDGFVDEIKTNAEVKASVTLPLQNLGEATVMPGTFSQGGGAAAVPNIAPVKIKINKLVVPAGKIK